MPFPWHLGAPPFVATRACRFTFIFSCVRAFMQTVLQQTRASEADTLLSSGKTIYKNRAIKAVVRDSHPAIGVNFFISSSPSIGIKHAVTEEKAEQDKTQVVHQITSPECTPVCPSVLLSAFATTIAAIATHFFATEPSHFLTSSLALVDEVHRHIVHLHPLSIPEICATFCGMCLPGRYTTTSRSSFPLLSLEALNLPKT